MVISKLTKIAASKKRVNPFHGDRFFMTRPILFLMKKMRFIRGGGGGGGGDWGGDFGKGP